MAYQITPKPQVSKWRLYTMEALTPNRLPWCRAANEPQPLAHPDAEPARQGGAFDVQLEVLLETAADRARGGAPQRLSATSLGTSTGALRR